MAAERDEIVVSPNHVVFDLPELVAVSEGLFAEAGLTVRFEDAADRSADALRNPAVRHKESQFSASRADVYNVCEWGGIDRLERDARGGRIGHLRAAVVAQALVSLDPDLNEPHDVAGVPVSINEYTGSHYTALHLLEGTVPRQRITLVHGGRPVDRLDALLAGDSRATMLMEPFLSAALVRGAHVLGTYAYRGSQVVAPHLTAEQQEAYRGAVNRAVDLINADRDRWAPLVAAEAGDRLDPADLRRDHYRYTHIVPFTERRFTETYAWMRSWRLTDGRSGYETLKALR
ncbi:nitrate ABC transporter substrate-binding protein [Pseudonocardia sp. EC080610-09]|uniref:ABC transporter substrate-binding protein n=1 Tax=unclassified Pseudonocardia TaxID=2619320 RepID=UPI0006CAFEAE|nr:MULTISPECIES: nitrate ABC transporter substrate-binding protein [unclassified Pseudonocardia]ALE72859.1 nitrate ABC transporter substrate-binding protein [Pseudonocardia sp. EC080625-04]ALL76182.1 nitrate ABC transporter substrate-binding protein [Pseudonocardia sp. EC080610-09]ALL83207.1 nitrate ABC transporter substrate-binding protein [Pseudonocardia sp. EC080619-01]